MTEEVDVIRIGHAEFDSSEHDCVIEEIVKKHGISVPAGGLLSSEAKPIREKLNWASDGDTVLFDGLPIISYEWTD